MPPSRRGGGSSGHSQRLLRRSWDSIARLSMYGLSLVHASSADVPRVMAALKHTGNVGQPSCSMRVPEPLTAGGVWQRAGSDLPLPAVGPVRKASQSQPLRAHSAFLSHMLCDRFATEIVPS